MLFGEDDQRDDYGSGRYCNAWANLSSDHEEEVRNHIRFKYAKIHGVRKGSATKSISGTICLPSILLIANQGEWSMGLVLDVY